jgi:hypothetical protein
MPENVITDRQTYRTKIDTQRVDCLICQEPLKKNDEQVTVTNEANETGPAHFWCAGTEGKLDTCTRCFMVSRDCDCA